MQRKSKANEIFLERVYDAPLAQLWEAWTDPAQLAQWWGPRGFSLTTHSRTLTPGGKWHYTMHGPDGTDYENKTLYLDVEPRKRLVYDHGGNDERKPLFRVTVHFSEEGGKAQTDMTMALATAEEAAETWKFVRSANGNSTWDRLAEHLEARASGREIFVLNRSFDAPLEKVFEMWTNPEHLARWIAPKGSATTFLRADIVPGGGTHFRMTNAEGQTLHGRADYSKIDAPSRLEYTHSICDEKGNTAPFPGEPRVPSTLLTRVTFAPESEGTTRVTIRWEPAPQTSDEQKAFFVGMRDGMMHGWNGSLDALEAILDGAARRA